MKRKFTIAFSLLILIFSACDDGIENNSSTGIDKFLLVTNITTSNPIIGYVGTLKDLETPEYTNSRARQFTAYPFITVYGDYVFAMPHRLGDVIMKYKRQPGGKLSTEGSMTMPAGSSSISIVIESDTKAYCSLWTLGKIAVFNPTTMTILSYIDLTSYALGGDGSPDPTVMALRNGKLYVGCSQTSDGYTSSHPAQIFIIDVANGNTVVSATDDRTTWAGSTDDQESLFFDENGDLYVFGIASYGFGGSSQKCGFLRIKNGETDFDPDYFFNVADYSIDGIPNNKVDYLQHIRYAGNGVAYCTGNIYALASNPPDYVNDRVLGSFRVDLANKTITKLDLPYSNSYAGSVQVYEGSVYFGLSTSTGVGLYHYDPLTNTASEDPVVNTEGDPSTIKVFAE